MADSTSTRSATGSSRVWTSIGFCREPAQTRPRIGPVFAFSDARSAGPLNSSMCLWCNRVWKENRKAQRSGNRKRQRSHAKRQSNWLSGAAILIAVVLGYLVMQTQKRLEMAQSELHKVSENAVQAKARIVDLEQIAAGQKR